MYKYYILPLRIFFSKFQWKRRTEAEKFFDYFSIILFTNFAPVGVVIIGNLDKRLHFDLKILAFLSFLFIVGVLIVTQIISKYFIGKYELSAEQIASKKLFLWGLLIYIEAFAFPLIAVPIFLYFHLHKFS